LHAALERLAGTGPDLLINGCTLAQLTLRAGQTPFYAYDRSLISQRVDQLRAALPARVEIHYAIKANPMPAVVQWLAGLVDGLDVASLGELQRALDSGVPAAEISFAGPAKTDRELAAAIASGVLINVESIGELNRIRALAQIQERQAQIALRVNPDFELKSSGMKMGGGAKPFGIDAEQIPGILDALRSGAVQLRGLHIFSGSQNLREEAIIEAQTQTLDLAERLTGYWGKPFEVHRRWTGDPLLSPRKTAEPRRSGATARRVDRTTRRLARNDSADHGIGPLSGGRGRLLRMPGA